MRLETGGLEREGDQQKKKNQVCSFVLCQYTKNCRAKSSGCFSLFCFCSRKNSRADSSIAFSYDWLTACLYYLSMPDIFVKRTSHRYKLWHDFANIKKRSTQMSPLSTRNEV
jgi:hypothetical protein